MNGRIARLTLDETTLLLRQAGSAHEKDRAVNDLLEYSCFTLKAAPLAAYHLHLQSEGKGLQIDISAPEGEALSCLTLPISPFKRVIKDYLLICESYFKAVDNAHPSKIEAIDMGRRGVHNEGASLLCSLIEEAVYCDFETSRRFFTLLSALYGK